MRTLIVGAGATGGYIGTLLVKGGRDVTFLVHPATRARLDDGGVTVREDGGADTTPVTAVTTAELRGSYDVVVLAVRSTAVDAAINDLAPAMGATTRVIPIVNGMNHLPKLVAAFGGDHVWGGVAQLATSLLSDGTIEATQHGAHLQIGALDDAQPDGVEEVAAELTVDGVSVRVATDIGAAMWDKFASITASAALTCLAGDVIGAIALASGGVVLAERVLDEVTTTLAAEAHPLVAETELALHDALTDPTSDFAPSLFRDLSAGRPVESAVLDDLARRARRHSITTPLLDTARVIVDIHARRIAKTLNTGRAPQAATTGARVSAVV